MSFIFPESRTKTVTVAAVGTDQVFPLFKVKKGDLILATALRRLIGSDAATDSTWQFGLNTAGLVLGAVIDTEGAVSTVVGSTVSAYRVLVDDTVEIRYVQGATDGAVAPSVRVNVVTMKNKGDL